MKNYSNRYHRVLVLTSTLSRWKNDPEPAFVSELSRSRYLRPACDVIFCFHECVFKYNILKNV